ncbi:MAG: chorismate lyase [Cycloclasticus sp.]
MKSINNFFVKEPAWRELSQWPLRTMPKHVVDWLLEPNSLTNRIKTTFHKPFSVSLKGQGLAKSFLADAQRLNQPPYRYALTREVELNIGGKPFVFARTTLPRKVAHNLQELTHLGSKPLGEVIFSYPDLKRVRLDLAKIDAAQLNITTRKLLAGQPYIWARRNTYQINKCTFLVSEFFLPALFESA